MTSSTPELARESERLFLAELLRSPSGVAGMTSAPPPYDKKPFTDGGKWRGYIPRALVRAGILAPVTRAEKIVAQTATRPARHRGFVAVWRLIDRAAAQRRLAELSQRRGQRHEQQTLFDHLDG